MLNKMSLSRSKKHKKPKDFPKRPLSAYNIFFQDIRKQILSDKSSSFDEFMDGVHLTHAVSQSANVSLTSNKQGRYANLTKYVSAKWQALDEETRKEYYKRSDIEREKNSIAMTEWYARQCSTGDGSKSETMNTVKSSVTISKRGLVEISSSPQEISSLLTPHQSLSRKRLRPLPPSLLFPEYQQNRRSNECFMMEERIKKTINVLKSYQDDEFVKYVSSLQFHLSDEDENSDENTYCKRGGSVA